MTIGLVLILLALLLIALLVQLRRTIATRALRRGSRVIHTSCGPIEFTVVGSGPAVLLFHGGMGGWDQAVALAVSLLAESADSTDYHAALREADAILKNRYAVICPSRVGYLRTPLSTGRTPAEGADAMAALLDELNVERAMVIGVSGGGPTALQFAIRHPKRTVALMEVAAITRRHLQPTQTTESLAGKIVFARGFGWFLDLLYLLALTYAAIAPVAACRRLLQATETFDADGIRARVASIRKSPMQLRWMRGLLRAGFPLSVRKIGLVNDVAQFAAIEDEDYALDRIDCPTRVIHGRHDGNVPLEHAEFVANGVDGAELVLAETCGHLMWMSEEEPRVRRAAIDFLAAHAGSATSLEPEGESSAERGLKAP